MRILPRRTSVFISITVWILSALRGRCGSGCRIGRDYPGAAAPVRSRSLRAVFNAGKIIYKKDYGGICGTSDGGNVLLSQPISWVLLQY